MSVTMCIVWAGNDGRQQPRCPSILSRESQLRYAANRIATHSPTYLLTHGSSHVGILVVLLLLRLPVIAGMHPPTPARCTTLAAPLPLGAGAAGALPLLLPCRTLNLGGGSLGHLQGGDVNPNHQLSRAGDACGQ